ncbi:hypothetical protein EJB05_24829, partial [Eragrostis curvula]
MAPQSLTSSGNPGGSGIDAGEEEWSWYLLAYSDDKAYPGARASRDSVFSNGGSRSTPLSAVKEAAEEGEAPATSMASSPSLTDDEVPSDNKVPPSSEYVSPSDDKVPPSDDDVPSYYGVSSKEEEEQEQEDEEQDLPPSAFTEEPDWRGIDEDSERVCYHGLPLRRKVWWGGRNSGRRFLGCQLEESPCAFFCWHDNPWAARVQRTMNDLWTLGSVTVHMVPEARQQLRSKEDELKVVKSSKEEELEAVKRRNAEELEAVKKAFGNGIAADNTAGIKRAWMAATVGLGVAMFAFGVSVHRGLTTERLCFFLVPIPAAHRRRRRTPPSASLKLSCATDPYPSAVSSLQSGQSDSVYFSGASRSSNNTEEEWRDYLVNNSDEAYAGVRGEGETVRTDGGSRNHHAPATSPVRPSSPDDFDDDSSSGGGGDDDDDDDDDESSSDDEEQPREWTEEPGWMGIDEDSDYLCDHAMRPQRKVWRGGRHTGRRSWEAPCAFVVWHDEPWDERVQKTINELWEIQAVSVRGMDKFYRHLMRKKAELQAVRTAFRHGMAGASAGEIRHAWMVTTIVLFVLVLFIVRMSSSSR